MCFNSLHSDSYQSLAAMCSRVSGCSREYFRQYKQPGQKEPNLHITHLKNNTVVIHSHRSIFLKTHQIQKPTVFNRH